MHNVYSHNFFHFAVPKNPAADAHLNYCVIKFSVENKSGAIVNALKAFPVIFSFIGKYIASYHY